MIICIFIHSACAVIPPQYAKNSFAAAPSPCTLRAAAASTLNACWSCVAALVCSTLATFARASERAFSISSRKSAGLCRIKTVLSKMSSPNPGPRRVSTPADPCQPHCTPAKPPNCRWTHLPGRADQARGSPGRLGRRPRYGSMVVEASAPGRFTCRNWTTVVSSPCHFQLASIWRRKQNAAKRNETKAKAAELKRLEQQAKEAPSSHSRRLDGS
jgi:hypothetical protein